MSAPGRKAADLHGKSLPRFSRLEEATAALYAFRNERLTEIHRLAALSGKFNADYAPVSLRALERWYFDLLESDAFEIMGVDVQYFEECMAMYFLETAVRNSDAIWTVVQNTFTPGRYEIGVKRPMMSYYRMRIANLPLLKHNKRRESLYREFVKYFGGASTAQ